jgi:hypothetical protein
MASKYDAQFSTDGRPAGIPIDFRAATLLEESQDNGYTRATKPVGTPTQPMPETQTTGGRGLTDTEAAFRLGANGRKK